MKTHLWLRIALSVAVWMAADDAVTAQRTVFALALPDGPVSCIAVADATAVSVRAPDGRELWHWAYAKGSRYIAPEAVAVSRECDAVALVGDAGYKYTWIVQKSGRAAAATAPGTPMSAAFDASGQRVAIGTAAGRVMLVGLDGVPVWTTDVSGHAAVVRRLHFTSAGHIAVTDGGALILQASGRVVWSLFATGSALSGDAATAAVWEQPPHGPGYGTVQLVNTASATPLWQTPIYSDSPEALVARDGSRVALWANRNQNVNSDADYVSGPPMDLCLVDAAGRLVVRVDVPRGRLLAGDKSLDRLLLDASDGIIEVATSGKTRVVVPREALGYDAVVLVADDYSGLVAGQPGSARAVRWVSLQ